MNAQNKFRRTSESTVFCNDTHSHLNRTPVRGRLVPTSVEDVVSFVEEIRERGEYLMACGSCHAMGGQQFASDGWLLDMRGMNRVLEFDADRGLIRVEAGITWPELMRHYVIAQHGKSSAWGIRQKQTGADRLTIGGAVSANIHGRGLTLPPFVSDLESLEVVLADGSVVECSRNNHPELFRHVVGGYGLFGIVTSAVIRLTARQKVQRVVQIRHLDEIAEAFQERIEAGYLYGDFQFSTAPEDDLFLKRGVFSCYRPVEPETSIPSGQIRLSPADWRRLIYLAHRNKPRAFYEFADFYLRSSGQIYWSDTHQLSLYLDDYHAELDRYCDANVPGSEVITELYVPPARLTAFMDDVRKDFLEHDVDLIYGTVRLIERDTESALPWARERFACIIFNLHVDHEPKDIARAGEHFRRLIDIAIHHGGSFFLTYHRHATMKQVLECYPQFAQFLRAKRAFDPQEIFRSDWYQHYKVAAESVA
ncbi:MAG TPA: FAD-binding oxidoreductase [Steroidobacteraceae bacterium]